MYVVYAAVVELADTRDLKSLDGDIVPVRPRSAAPKRNTSFWEVFLFVFVSAGHNIVLQRSCKHHLIVGQHHSACGHKTMLPSANSVVLRRNDVASPTMLRLRRKYTHSREILHVVQMYGIIFLASEVIAMKEDKLSDLSMQLSVDVLKLTKELRAKQETIISNQIGRSATSVCANIAESKYGHSRADFIAKLEIALKEANETGKWLEMLFKSDYISVEKYKELNKTCSTIRILLIASIKTAKENSK